ncbi:MAG: ABC transporter substrate-binding protein [Rhizobiaceae bacterium]|nr:ABC transporter substrate-binding protein [Rhizobiaceae bacterium]
MTRKFHLLTAAAMIAIAQPAAAQGNEKVKVATTFLGLWDTSQPSLCAERGEFAKAGLDVEVTSTRGGSENVQAVVAGGMDIGYSPGINSVLAAAGQGAPIKIISSEFRGQNDSFFYVKADSPIKSMDDLAGKSIAYSRPGGASEAILLALKADRNIDLNLVTGGGMDATYTMAMTGQIDVGYAVPPTMLKEAEEGKIRVIFSGDDVESQRGMTQRLIIASDDFLSNRREVATKFLEVLDQCIDWAYANPEESLAYYAKLNKVDPAIAKKGMEFYKRETLAFGPIQEQEKGIAQAVAGGFIKEKPSEEALKDLVQILYTTPAK